MSPGAKARIRAAYDVALAVYAVALGATLGLASAFWAVEGDYPFGRQDAGPWHVWPQLGSRAADPYARAIIARTGDIPLGAGEGLAFHATRDDAGRFLDAACVYLIDGPTPPARYWTLTIYDAQGRLVGESLDSRSVTSSARVLRGEDGAARLVVAREPQSGNWVAPPPAGRFEIVLRLYDTQTSGALTRFSAGSLPSLSRVECPA